MSAHQALLTNSKSVHVFNFATAPGSGDGNYYGAGCGTATYGYISGSLGSITSGSTFRGLTITKLAAYQYWSEQNDSQNTDPYEWYCRDEGGETVLAISGATDQYFFKRIIVGNGEILLPGNATFGSGTWSWNYSVGLESPIIIEY